MSTSTLEAIAALPWAITNAVIPFLGVLFILGMVVYILKDALKG